MRDRGTLNPGNQHLTHLMLMSGIIINISHTHTHTNIHRNTMQPISSSHLHLHRWQILPSSSMSACLHKQINAKRTQSERAYPVTLSVFFPLPQLYEFTLWLSVYLPIRLKPSQTHFISSSTGEPRLISQRCLVPRRANARSLPSVISPPSLFTLCFCSFFPLIHLWYISAFEVRCDTIKRLPFLPNSFTRHRGWGPCGDPTFRSSPQPAQHSALNPGRAKVDQSKCNFLQDYT